MAEADGAETEVIAVPGNLWTACAAIAAGDVSVDAGREVVVPAAGVWMSTPGPWLSGDVTAPTVLPVSSVGAAKFCDGPVDRA